jgi:anthranilate synthase component I
MVTADLTLDAPGEAYDRAVQRLGKLEKRLARPLPKLPRVKDSGKLKIEYRTRKKDYLAAVERTKEYISAGDVFQTVLSQRFDMEPGTDTFQVYRALRTVNPSPYMYFLRFTPDGDLDGTTKAASATKSKQAGAIELAGSSPELLVRVHQGKVEYRPIAGTRPRGANEAEDLALENEMMHDEKERAEHVMLVDLGRNDVGRVSEFGSVKVDRLMYVERYSHVMHIVSTIEGRLKSELTAVDALRACFPAGTLSGAPKCGLWRSSKNWNPRGAEPTAVPCSTRTFLEIWTRALRFVRCLRRTAKAMCKPAQASWLILCLRWNTASR